MLKMMKYFSELEITNAYCGVLALAVVVIDTLIRWYTRTNKQKEVVPVVKLPEEQLPEEQRPKVQRTTEQGVPVVEQRAEQQRLFPVVVSTPDPKNMRTTEQGVPVVEQRAGQGVVEQRAEQGEQREEQGVPVVEHRAEQFVPVVEQRAVLQQPMPVVVSTPDLKDVKVESPPLVNKQRLDYGVTRNLLHSLTSKIKDSYRPQNVVVLPSNNNYAPDEQNQSPNKSFTTTKVATTAKKTNLHESTAMCDDVVALETSDSFDFEIIKYKKRRFSSNGSGGGFEYLCSWALTWVYQDEVLTFQPKRHPIGKVLPDARPLYWNGYRITKIWDRREGTDNKKELFVQWKDLWVPQDSLNPAALQDAVMEDERQLGPDGCVACRENDTLCHVCWPPRKRKQQSAASAEGLDDAEEQEDDDADDNSVIDPTYSKRRRSNNQANKYIGIKKIRQKKPTLLGIQIQQQNKKRKACYHGATKRAHAPSSDKAGQNHQQFHLGQVPNARNEAYHWTRYVVAYT